MQARGGDRTVRWNLGGAGRGGAGVCAVQLAALVLRSVLALQSRDLPSPPFFLTPFVPRFLASITNAFDSGSGAYVHSAFVRMRPCESGLRRMHTRPVWRAQFFLKRARKPTQIGAGAGGCLRAEFRQAGLRRRPPPAVPDGGVLHHQAVSQTRNLNNDCDCST